MLIMILTRLFTAVNTVSARNIWATELPSKSHQVVEVIQMSLVFFQYSQNNSLATVYIPDIIMPHELRYPVYQPCWNEATHSYKCRHGFT